MGLFKKPQKSQSTSKKTEQQYPTILPGMGECIVTKSILNGSSQLKWMVRDEDIWIAFGDSDSQEYVDDVNNMELVDFSVLTEIEPAAGMIFYLPPGSDLEFCKDASGSYFVDTVTQKVIREAVKHPAQLAFEKNLKFLNQDSYPKEFFTGLFQDSEKIRTILAGETDFPTGRVVLADPLAYLGTPYQTTLERCIPAGRYPVQLAAVYSQIAGFRIGAARLVLSSEEIVKYELAQGQKETVENGKKPKPAFPFFGVDTGLACFADEKTAEEYRRFSDSWQQQNPDKNLYTDYFQQQFLAGAADEPAARARAEKMLAWSLPQSGSRLVLFSSGMGDGIYSGYWALDRQGRPVELIVPFLNPEFF